MYNWYDSYDSNGTEILLFGNIIIIIPSSLFQHNYQFLNCFCQLIVSINSVLERCFVSSP